MNETIINFKGHPYRREVEMLGDVEKVRWYNTKLSGYSEIHSQEELDELEGVYDATIIKELTPVFPII